MRRNCFYIQIIVLSKFIFWFNPEENLKWIFRKKTKVQENFWKLYESTQFLMLISNIQFILIKRQINLLEYQRKLVKKSLLLFLQSIVLHYRHPGSSWNQRNYILVRRTFFTLSNWYIRESNSHEKKNPIDQNCVKWYVI